MRGDTQKSRKEFQAYYIGALKESNLILGVVLFGHIYIENTLNKILKCHLEFAYKIEKYPFLRKVELLEGIGAGEKHMWSKIKNFNKIRNEYAHSLKYKIEDSLIIGMSSDGADIKLWKKYPEDYMIGEISYLAGYLDAVLETEQMMGVLQHKARLSTTTISNRLSQKK